MTDDRLIRLGLRIFAIAIAVAALIDPAIRGDNRRDATIVIHSADSARDGELANRVASVLGKRFDISRAEIIGADANVVVGSRVPAIDGPAPVFVVARDPRRAALTIERVDVPRTAAVESRVPVAVQTHVVGSRGRTVEVTMATDGLVVDRVTRRIDRDDDTLSISLNYIPAASGDVVLDVTASVDGGASSDRESAAVQVRAVRRSILFYDPRPSWPSTFVRRMIEEDPRFGVTSRTFTSRNISTDAGSPPPTLQDATALAGFDAIVVGAPEALSVEDVAGLERYLRRRGGSVVLLLDQRTAGAYDRLTGTDRWTTAASNQPTVIPVTHGDTGSLRIMSLAWPTPLPGGAEVLAGNATRPAVWTTNVGAGRLFVSGALDSWRFRDSLESSFEPFWRMVIAEAAASSPPAIALASSPTIVRPGGDVQIVATVRDVALAGDSRGTVTTAMGARVDSIGAVSLWPVGLGKLRGEFRAPSRPGTYRVSVTDGRETANSAIIVAERAPLGWKGSGAALEEWARLNGGAVISEADLGRLADRIAAGISARPRLETSHPMRSAWWIVPFSLALAAEWFLRRRRGIR